MPRPVKLRMRMLENRMLNGVFAPLTVMPLLLAPEPKPSSVKSLIVTVCSDEDAVLRTICPAVFVRDFRMVTFGPSPSIVMPFDVIATVPASTRYVPAGIFSVPPDAFNADTAAVNAAVSFVELSPFAPYARTLYTRPVMLVWAKLTLLAAARSRIRNSFFIA